MYIWDIQNKLHHRANIIPNSNLNLSTIQALKDMLEEVNPYVINLRHILYLPSKNFRNLSMLIHINIPGLDQRTHNAPSSSEVAAIWIENDTPPGFSGCYDPLAYPLLFPHGEQGWAPRQIPYRNIPFSNKSIDIDESPNSELIKIDESPNNKSIDIDESPNNGKNDNELEITDEHQHNVQHTSVVIDEIQNFVEARWISAPEAVWRILGFNMNKMNPAVTRLQVHLRDQQRINFNEDDNIEEVIDTEQNQRTTLTEYFKMNAQDPDARDLLYADFLCTTHGIRQLKHGKSANVEVVL
ncbi:12819_t:CDS:2 [Gigaspora margarita]|uniref:12819_t:CDS:1 n=1 Tax=Gigaspora margarita TaxID=4874 RepID=A0ABN7UAF2_GIGMA|nr:12819_t:CDS:2 [Gigaspora margarita]